MAEELVDVLTLPNFEPSGVVKTREQAYDDGEWLRTFNLWIVRTDPVPSILYQRRGENVILQPGVFDIAVAGHYTAGESLMDGLREAEEEIGKKYDQKDIIFVGRKIHIGLDAKDRVRHNIIYVYMTLDNTPLEDYKIDKSELDSLYILPIEDLLKQRENPNYTFEARGIDDQGRKLKTTVSADKFFVNWDNYRFVMCKLAQRLVKGEKDLYI